MDIHDWTEEYGSSSGPFVESEAGVLPIQIDFCQLDESLEDAEKRVTDRILLELKRLTNSRIRTEGDPIFGQFSKLLHFYKKLGLTHRAVIYARFLISETLKFESTSAIEVHKGALFYDAALAHFVMGDMDRGSYLLAMANEEDVETSKGESNQIMRGQLNLMQGELSRQLARLPLNFIVAFLNEPLIDPLGQGGFQFIFDKVLVLQDFDTWRKSLDAVHHFELFRMIQELDVFDKSHLKYNRVLDHPYVLLRLAKVLAHLAQWLESYLNVFQGAKYGDSLSPRLNKDPVFAPFCTAAGSPSNFAGNCPRGVHVDIELRRLLSDINNSTDSTGRRWRILRIAYIVRNTMSHQIDANLGAYQDRNLLRQLIQMVILASLVIYECKSGKSL